MAQNSFFLDEIDCEATKMQANAHLQNSLPGKGIPLKTTQTYLTIFWELHSDIAYLESKNFQCLKFYKLFVRFVMLLVEPIPLDLWISLRDSSRDTDYGLRYVQYTSF